MRKSEKKKEKKGISSEKNSVREDDDYAENFYSANDFYCIYYSRTVQSIIYVVQYLYMYYANLYTYWTIFVRYYIWNIIIARSGFCIYLNTFENNVTFSIIGSCDNKQNNINRIVYSLKVSFSVCAVSN